MRHVFDYIRNNKIIFFLLIPAFLFHMLIIMPSGGSYCDGKMCGLFFWGAHGHDAIWHLAVVAASFKTFPFIAPTFAGGVLIGYNYLMDFVIYLFTKLGFSALFIYFKLLPVVWFMFFTSLAVILARKIKDSLLYVCLLLFFFFFAGSFSYLLTWYHQHTIWNSAATLAMQAGLTLVNLQFAFSLVFLMGILILIKDRGLNWKKAFLLSLFVFINLGLKFYGGIVSAIIVGMYFLIAKDQNKISFFQKTGFLLLLALISGVAVLIFYNPFASIKTGSVLSFQPLATVHPIIEEPDLFYLKNTVNARYFLQAHGGIGPKLIEIETMTLLIYLVFNFGTRFFGFFYLGFQILKRKFTQFDFLVLTGTIAATLLTILFVQKGQWWNTVQFLYYAFFLSNFFIAGLVYDLMSNKKIAPILIGSLILFLTVPVNIDLVRVFSTFPAQSYVSNEEFTALHFLQKQPKGTVYFVSEKKIALPQDFNPKPLYAYNDTAYIAAFSGQQVYFGDEVQLQLTGIEYESRQMIIKNENCRIFNQVNYVYDIKEKKDDFWRKCQNSTTFKKIFDNEQIALYKKL